MRRPRNFVARTTNDEIHETTVDALVARLLVPDRYKTIEKHLLFASNGVAGEADVIATTHGGSVHYYEIKCRYHPNNYKKAQEQFTKFAHMCPATTLRFIYVTPTMVKRVYNERVDNK